MNTHINKRRANKPKYEREYLGITITAKNYREILEKEGREGINFHTKHLKSYIKGLESFNYGFEKNEDGSTKLDRFGIKLPRSFRVQSRLTKV